MGLLHSKPRVTDLSFPCVYLFVCSSSPSCLHSGPSPWSLGNQAQWHACSSGVLPWVTESEDNLKVKFTDFTCLCFCRVPPPYFLMTPPLLSLCQPSIDTKQIYKHFSLKTKNHLHQLKTDICCLPLEHSPQRETSAHLLLEKERTTVKDAHF